jgi:inorganic pyrophosphatase
MIDKSYHEWRPHPWHGLEIGSKPPELVNAYIEMTPFELIKYEVDKNSGYLRVDRPQRNTAHVPSLYGFIPRTYCGERVGALAGEGAPGDGDPLDICVISERPIARTEVLMSVRVIGGICMIDGGEADDKIIAVLESDDMWGEARELGDVPKLIVDRLVHYFNTYKSAPGQKALVDIQEVYDRERAFAIVEASAADYLELFGHYQQQPG